MRISSKALALSVILLAVPLAPSSFSAPAPIAEAKRIEAQVLSLIRARRFTEALPLAKRALQIREKALGAEHPRLLLFLNRLAFIHTTQKNSKEARALRARAVAMQKKLTARRKERQKKLAARRKAMRAKTLEVRRLNEKAIGFYRAGRYKDALPLLRRALAIAENTLEPGHIAVAASLSGLAMVHLAQGRYQEAEPLYRRSLSVLEKALGPVHPGVAKSLNSLALLYRLLGRYKEAALLHRRALAIYEKLGKHKKAASIKRSMQKVLAARRKVDRAKAGEAIRLDAQMVRLYRAGRYAEAASLAQRALAIYEKTLGPGHRRVAASLYFLALLYHAQSRYKDAEPLFRRALAIQEKSLGLGHPDVASTLNNLAELYRVQGRYKKAEPLYRRALTIIEKALGPGHRRVATSLYFLALLYHAQSRYKKAEPLFRRALAISEKVFGPFHPFSIKLLNSMAILYGKLGKKKEAAAFSARAKAMKKRLAGR
jgi:tetratricopeptide (TPR) repeat protein